MSPRVFLALLGTLLVLPAHAQDEFTPAADSLQYRELVERLAVGDTLIDFTQLRFLFAAEPRPADAADPATLFKEAERAETHSAARDLVDSALANLYGHVGAHQAAARLFTQRGDSARADFHRAVVRGFIRSIEAGGAERADGWIPVISIAEEYALIRERGLERASQSLSRCGEYHCDSIDARNPETGEEVTFTFLLTWWQERREPRPLQPNSGLQG